MNGSREQAPTLHADGAEHGPAAPAGHRPVAPGAPENPPPAGWGSRRSANTDPRYKSVPLACFLSIMPGLGQVYVGYYKQGFVNIVVFAGTIAALATLEGSLPLTPLLGLFLPFFFLYNIVDAGRRATFYNQALLGMEGFDLPQDLSLPGPGGSMAGGLILIVVGFVFLSYTVLDISLAWLEDWWPVAPILFGAYLFWRGLQERGESS